MGDHIILKEKLANWKIIRTFAVDFNREITKRYADLLFGNVRNFHCDARLCDGLRVIAWAVLCIISQR